MAEPTPLQTLIEMARDGVNRAARQLAQMLGSQRDAEAQLLTLRGYRDDYAERLRLSAQNGLTASNYHNFRQFIATLDEAILQQNRLVGQIAAKVEGGRQQWQEEKRRLNSFEALLTRQAAKRAQLEVRREQRASDEISARLFQRAASH